MRTAILARPLAAILFAFGFFVWFKTAHAQVRYDYTGNQIPWHFIDRLSDGQGTFMDVPVDTWLQVNATIDSPSPLVIGSNLLTPGLTFSMFITSPYISGSIAYPLIPGMLPPYAPEFGPYHAVLQIGALGTSGLPTAWDISINHERSFPRGVDQSYRTSTFLDSAQRAQNVPSPIGTFDLSIANSPGVWMVSAVPEAEVYSMMLVGLGLVGFAARRRRSPPS